MAQSVFAGLSTRVSHHSSRSNSKKRNQSVDRTKFDRNERLIQAENSLINYNAITKQLKQSLKESKLQIKQLQTQNKVKDQLLQERERDIINKTTEIINLKEEIYTLRQQILSLKQKPSRQDTNHCQRGMNNHNNNTNNLVHISTNLVSDRERERERESKPKPYSNRVATPRPSSKSKKSKNKSKKKVVKKKVTTKPSSNIKSKKKTKPKTKSNNNLENNKSKSLPNDDIVNKFINNMIMIDEGDGINTDNEEIYSPPFIHRKSSTQTSSLSACAVKLALPSPKLQLLAASGNNNNNVLSTLQLSPICESNSRDEYSKQRKSPPTRKSNTNSPNRLSVPDSPQTPPMSLIKISDDNSNINDEWGASIAGSDDELAEMVSDESVQENVTPIPNDGNLNDKMSKDGDQKTTEDIQYSAFENKQKSTLKQGNYIHIMTSRLEQQGETIADYEDNDNVSYCTDNEYMYQDIMNGITCGNVDSDTENDNAIFDDDNNSINSLTQIRSLSKRHFSKKSHTSLSGCDIIEAPINIFSINHSLFVLNKPKHGNVVTNMTSDNVSQHK